MALTPRKITGQCHVAARTLASTTAVKKDAESNASIVSSFSSSSSNTTIPCWQDKLHCFWEQASGDAALRVLKDQVSNASLEFDESVRLVAQQRRLVEKCQKQHEESYQRHASLLMRREQWTPNEASLFVEITSQEVKARQALQEARQDLHTFEERASRLQQTYMNALRRKYEEEQAWQDRWRVMGTFGTWSLIGLNSVVFLLSQVLFYRREATRLVDIENLIKNHNNSNNAIMIPPPVGEQEDTMKEDAVDNDDTVSIVNEETDQDLNRDANSETGNAQDEERPSWASRLNELKQELVDNLHVPSAAAGAVTSATLCVLLGIILSRR